MNSRNLVQEFARRIGSCMFRIKNDVRDIANAKFQPVISFQVLALHAFAIDERSVFAALIEHIELAVIGRYQRMIARDTRIGNYQILIYFAPDAERAVIEIDGALLVALHEDERRENA